MNKKIAVVLMNLGGPDSLDAVQPFLQNLFSDPDIFKIPLVQKPLAKFIAKNRAPKVVEEYKLIGGKSPIGYWTELQRKMLEERLNQDGSSFKIFISMRYWKPFTSDVVQEIEKELFEKIILLPLYPQYSISTTGSSINEWNRVYKGPSEKIIVINDFYQNENYLKAINERIDQALNDFECKRDEVYFLFSAHGVPVSYIKKGDPYQKQIEETVQLVMSKRNFSNPFSLAYQSKVGPMKWLEPSTDSEIERLIQNGIKNLLLIPIAFVSDHIETLYELDIEYRKIAEGAGAEKYVIMKGLNDSQLFIEALAEEVWKKL
ncbi:MAG: ferrochelatase [Ignavibacteria bacterium]